MLEAALKFKDVFDLLDMRDNKFGVELSKNNGSVAIEKY